MTQKVELREARFQDYKAIAALEESQGLTSKPFDEWRRMWAGNPCYQELGTLWPIGWVLEVEDRIVGSLGNIPLPYMFRGRKILAAAGHGLVLEENYRGYAGLLIDEQLNQEKVELLLNNTSTRQAYEAFSTSGFLRVPVGDWTAAAFTVTEHRGFAASTLRSQNVPAAHFFGFPAGLALLIKDKIARVSIPRTDIPVTIVRDFDQRFDTFWEILSQRSQALLAVRSREILKWHFGAHIDQKRLWILTTARNGNLDAFAVLQRSDEARSGLKRMRMVDFQAYDWQDQYCAAFMQKAYDECRRQGIHVLEMVGCNREKTRIFDQSAPHRRALPGSSFYYKARSPELCELLASPDAWDPSSFDGDSSL